MVTYYVVERHYVPDPERKSFTGKPLISIQEVTLADNLSRQDAQALVSRHANANNIGNVEYYFARM